MAFKLQDLIDIEHFQMLQDRLNEIYSFPSAIIDNDGNILTATAWQDVCTQFHRQNSECEKECIKSDQYIADHLHEANPAVSYRCPHGLIDNATPIIIEGIHYGNFFTGQFFLEPPDLDFFRAQAERYGFNEEAYMEAVEKVPIWTREQLNGYLFFIKGLIEVIAGIGLKNLREIETCKRMQEREERFRTILLTATDGFWRLDLQGRLLEVNETYCRMSGYSMQELLTMRISDLEAAETEDDTASHMRKIIMLGEDRFESRHRRKDGSIFDVEVRVQHRASDGGWFVAFIRDITERKQAEEEKSRHQEEVERLAEEMAIIAEIGRVVGSTLDISQVFERVDTAIRKLVSYDRLLVNLKKNENEFVVVYTSGVDNPGRRLGDTYRSTGTASHMVMTSRTGLLIQPQNAGEIEKAYPNLYETFKAGLRSTMSVPLISMDRVIGSLVFRSKKLKAYTERDLSLAEKIGMQIAGAIANAQLYRDVKETEKSLRKSEERFRALVEHAAVGVAEIDMATGRFLTVNHRFCEMIGRTEEEVLTITFQSITHPEDLHRHKDKTALLRAGKIAYYNLEKRYFRKDGAIIWVNITVSPLWKPGEEPGRNMIVVEDITERKRTEESLQQAHRQLTALFNGARDAIFIVDIETGLILDANDEAAILLNMPRPSLIGLHHTRLHPADVADFHRERFLERSRIPHPELVEAEILTSDGHRVSVEISARSIELFGKRAMVAIFRDISDRKRVQDALRESEERFRLAYYTSPDAININRLNDGLYVDINEGFTRLTGFTPEDVIGKTSQAIDLWCHPEDRQTLVRGLRENGYYENLEAEFRRKDGSIASALMSARVLVLQGVPHILSITRDISEIKRVEEEKRRLEERLQRAEKMEALGQLAGGVAHDLNNVLGILSGYSELLLEQIPEGHRSRNYVEKILHSTDKGAAIIQDLLTLARRGVASSVVINLNDIVFEFLKAPTFDTLQAYHPHVTFRAKCDKNLLNIKGSPVHLEKTLMNLVSNAAESITGKGEVTITTESRYLDRAITGYDDVKEGDYAVLTVSDTGMGIPVENREKIFEPFYTKKTMGRSGTGLGLAIVWGTVKDLSGYIDVQTEVGQGTTFTLYFPVTRDERIVPEQKVPMERYMGNGESVLVVDDVAEQRDVAAKLLARLGYEVHLASSGEEAVEYVKRNHPDILVLDMIMPPGMDGLETYRQVLAINPKQKAILVSGFSETERVREAQRLGAGAYVKKPYLTEKIGIAIKKGLKG